ncbi:GTP-binding protein 8-like isoform X2 [Corythoichthys intestinalis]|uniref:GTP-binding protein 8-like isoform X2 n=1 Tax=Corythoichthys intestinalis TaxID=161448 RepID=UPI0025A5B389|nr:GTP-binding protein 8-like isoform X2 [Corythoichthys intestinalis]XP_057708296.1 GTP-binding protein 8-like isoform X2 [Corythoichthys intestinalis]XP_061799234.1 GTP-binding protein 8-like [Nerophis lumbriciformis]
MIYLHPLSWLQPGIKMCTFPQHRIHKLASLQEARVRYPNKVKSLLYPFTDVETYLDSSVDRTQFQLFHPCMNDLLKAEKLFCSSPSHKIDYYVSAERMDHSPALKQPEVCFIGRSNVGKSSLVKCLFSLSPNVEVRISKTPGHTKKMNFFKVGRAFTIVDMPGYGYKAPRDFVEMVEPYLYSRKTLVRTFILVDGSVGLQKTDHIALEMCEETGSPYVMVVTKIDKCSRGSLLTNLLKFQDVIKTQTSSCFPQPFLVSSLQFSGIYLLRCFIAHITGNLQLKDTSQS